MDVGDITEGTGMEYRSEQQDDESQETFRARTAESHVDEGSLHSEKFLGTQHLPTGAVGPMGTRQDP